MQIRFSVKKAGRDTMHWLNKLTKQEYLDILESCGKEGVDALRSNTPVRTGVTAASWDYTIERSRSKTSICWTNSNVTRDGQPIAILLQYGHGTGTGGYVVGKDYINPSMKPVFDKIADKVWKAVIAYE